MREAIGGTWLFGLVITFIVFFASFLAISVNYSKAFNVKNNVVDLISKYEGNNCNARKNIGKYLNDVGYLVTGECKNVDGVDYIPYDLNGNEVTGSTRGYYCVAKDNTGSSTDIDKSYYRVMVFFRVDLPVIGNLTTFRIKGETESIYYAKDESASRTCS